MSLVAHYYGAWRENTFTAHLVCELNKTNLENQANKITHTHTLPPPPKKPPLYQKGKNQQKNEGGGYASVFILPVLLINLETLIIFECGLSSSSSDIWPVIHVRPHIAHCWSVVTALFRTG